MQRDLVTAAEVDKEKLSGHHKAEGGRAMNCPGILKRGYLFDKKVGILPMTVVSNDSPGVLI